MGTCILYCSVFPSMRSKKGATKPLFLSLGLSPEHHSLVRRGSGAERWGFSLLPGLAPQPLNG